MVACTAPRFFNAQSLVGVFGRRNVENNTSSVISPLEDVVQ
jgi:hypothetical protein